MTQSTGPRIQFIDGLALQLRDAAPAPAVKPAPERGAITYSVESHPVITNCTFYHNFSTFNGDELAGISTGTATIVNSIVWGQIHGSLPTITYSCVKDGWPGVGNIDVLPSFAAPGAGNLRLTSGSSGIDAGDSGAVPVGILTDFDGRPRFVDDPDAADACLSAPCVDMGAFEFQTECPWDCAMPNDGEVNVTDFLALLAAWGQSGVPCDLDGGGIGVTDFLELLANWGTCP